MSCESHYINFLNPLKYEWGLDQFTSADNIGILSWGHIMIRWRSRPSWARCVLCSVSVVVIYTLDTLKLVIMFFIFGHSIEWWRRIRPLYIEWRRIKATVNTVVKTNKTTVNRVAKTNLIDWAEPYMGASLVFPAEFRLNIEHWTFILKLKLICLM